MMKPRYRFKKSNCSDYPEWKEVPFCIAFSSIGNNTLSRSELSLDVKTSVRNIHYGDILIKYGSIIHSSFDAIPYIIKIDDKSTKEKMLKNGDVIFADTAEDNSVGKACEIVLDDEFDKIVAGLHTIAVRPNESFAIGYLGYFFNSALFHNQLLPLIQGIKVSSISKRALFTETKVYYPSLPEQQKIADFLSSYDEKISIQRERVEALERRKKGLLQKIFSQETRFDNKQTGIYPKWCSMRIDEFASVFSSARVHKNEWTNNGIPFWRSSDLMSARKGIKNPMGEAYISEDLYKKLSERSGKVKKGDLLITGGGSIGIPYYINNDNPMYMKDADLLCIQSNNSFNSKFLYYFFETSIFRNYLSTISHKGTISHYTITQIKETPVSLPCIDEQEKIADLFTAIDDQINIEKERLTTMETIKKGLLQGLFC